MQKVENTEAEKPEGLSIVIPFSGFYESAHSALLDQEVESVFQDHATGCYNRVPDDFYSHYNTRKAENEYAELYVKSLNALIEVYSRKDLKLSFADVDSPKYYNFTTDRIFGFIPAESVLRMWKVSKAEKHETLESMIREKFTSRDGFASHYQNSLSDTGQSYKTSWPADPLEWDHNQLETLLESFMAISGMDEDNLSAWDLMGDYSGNGDFSNIVWGAMDDTMTAYANFFDTLQRDKEEKGERIRDFDNMPTFEEWQQSPDYALYCFQDREKELIPMEFEEWQESALGVTPRCPNTPDMFEAGASIENPA